MDYSVGSLADLITGSDTPNKPKVVQKVFKKEIGLSPIKSKKIKKEVEDPYSTENSPVDNRKSKIKKIKKETDIDQNALENSHVDNRNSKIKKIKKEIDVDQNESENSLIDNRKPKVKKIKEEIDVDQITSENSHVKKNKLSKKKRRALKNENIGNEQDTALQPIKKNKVKKLKLNDKNNTSTIEDVTEVNSRKRKLETSASNFLDSDEDESPESPPKKEKTDFQQNAERRVKKKVKEEKKAQDPEELSRTIYVGNVPINIDKKKIKKYFKKYGTIETIRVRSIPVSDPKISKKTAAIKKDFNPKRNNVCCYIRFQTKEDALKAEAEDGVLFEEHHLRVHACQSKEKPDETKAIFVGNLSFDAEEDELWNLFEECGPISHVRIIRDAYTGMGKGFGYVNFKDSDAVQLALEMENVKLKNRELRISLSNLNVARKNKKFNKNKKITQAGKQKFRKPFNKNSDEETPGTKKGKTTEINAEFQGAKFNDKKKKRKTDRGLLEKKKLVKKIAPRIK